MRHTVTMAVFRNPENPEVLTITRGSDPCKGQNALPGGYVEHGEEFIDAAIRELEEETGLSIGSDMLDYLCDQEIEPGIDHLFTAMIGNQEATAGSDATDLRWSPLQEVGPLAFHHTDFLNKAKDHLKGGNIVSDDIIKISRQLSEDIKFNNGFIIEDDSDVSFHYPEKDDDQDWYTDNEKKNMKVMNNPNFPKIVSKKMESFPGPDIIVIAAPTTGPDLILKSLQSKYPPNQLQNSILYVQSGFNDHVMTPWILAHNIGHAFFDDNEDLVYKAQNLIVGMDEAQWEKAKRIPIHDNPLFRNHVKNFSFKSARASQGRIAGDKEVARSSTITDWTEYIIEMFASFLLNGGRIHLTSASYANHARELEAFFMNLLEVNRGKLVFSGS